MQIVKRDPFF